jgi:hypothetical protein
MAKKIEKKIAKKVRQDASPPPERTYTEFEVHLAVAREAEKAVDDRIVKDFMRNARAMRHMKGLSLDARTENSVANVMSLMRVLERHGW